jgi:arylsulfatase A-like enzyme
MRVAESARPAEHRGGRASDGAPDLAARLVGAGAIAAALAATIVACSGPAPAVRPDLFADPYLVRLDALFPSTLFDGEGGSLLTGEGWSHPFPAGDPEISGGAGVQAVELRSKIHFLAPPPGDYDFYLRCHALADGAAPAGVTLRLLGADGRQLISGEIGPDWTDLRRPVPADSLPFGISTWSLEFRALSGSPPTADFVRRTRPSWVACSALAVVPRTVPYPLALLLALRTRPAPGQPMVFAPPRSLSIPIPPGAELRLDLASVAASPECPLVARLRSRLGEEEAARLDDPRAHGRIAVRAAPGAAAELLVMAATDSPACRAHPPAAAFSAGAARIALARPEPGQAPNAFLYLVDTLRVDSLDWGAGDEVTAPSVRAFRERAVDFVNAAAPASWTLPSVTSLLTGRYPDRHGVLTWSDKLPADGAPTLPGALGALGYQTVGISQSWLAGPTYGLERGFGSFYLDDEFNGVELRSQQVRGFLRAWLLAQWRPERPIAVYLHTVDPHNPYSPPTAFRRWSDRVRGSSLSDVVRTKDLDRLAGEVPAADRVKARELYRGEVAFADLQFGRFLDLLRVFGLWDPSTIVFLADHGEEFAEHGRYGHGQSLFEEVERVPLVVKFPSDEGAGSRVDRRVSLVDLFPTLLRLAGARPSRDLDGRDLGAAHAGSDADSDWTFAVLRPIGRDEQRGIILRSASRGAVKCILTTDLDGRPVDGLPAWQFLATPAAPVSEPLLESTSPDSTECRRALARWISERRRTYVAGERAQPTEEQIEQLRSVGYLR